MSDAITVHPGARPWLPSTGDDTVLEAVYHRHDTPLIGVVRQAGVSYLFQCLAGALEPFSVWDYTIIHEDEQEQLDAADVPELFSKLVHEFSSRPGVVAVAVQGAGIVAAEQYDDTPFRMAVERLFSRFDEWMDHVRGAADRQRDLCDA